MNIEIDIDGLQEKIEKLKERQECKNQTELK